MINRILLLSSLLLTIDGFSNSKVAVNFLKWLKPSISLYSVYTNSEITSTGDMQYYFSPTSELKQHQKLSMGLQAQVRIIPALYFSIGGEIVEKGHATEKTRVRLSTDPFVHDFESHVMVKYISYPILLQTAVEFAGLSVGIKGGIIISELLNSSMEWTIDGVHSSYAPKPNVRENEYAATYGAEVGYRLHAHGLFTSYSRFHGLQNMAERFSGSAKFNGWQVATGYRFFIR